MPFVDQLLLYFKGEKTESAIILFVSFIFFISGLYFFFKVNEAFLEGFGTVLVIIGLIGLLVGGTVFFRTDKQVTNLVHLLDKNKAEFVQQELKRMESVVSSFIYYKYVYYISIISSFVLLLFFSKSSLLKGIGIGLLAFALIGFLIDHFAEKRANIYLNAIKSIELPV